MEFNTSFKDDDYDDGDERWRRQQGFGFVLRFVRRSAKVGGRRQCVGASVREREGRLWEVRVRVRVRVRIWEMKSIGRNWEREYLYLGFFFLILYIWVGFGSGEPDLVFFFFFNPYPILLFVGSGKIRSIRIRPGRVPTGRAFIAISTLNATGHIFGVVQIVAYHTQNLASLTKRINNSWSIWTTWR